MKQRFPWMDDFALLFMRVGLGAMFAWHGWGKVMEGPVGWEKLGRAVTALGLHTGYLGFGAAATFSEFVGGLLLVVGLAVRPAAFFLVCTMTVAAAMHFDKGDGLTGASHAIEAGVAFVGILLMGGGKYALDAKVFGRR